LRDWLQLNEAADLAAQLPTLLRGAYYEQWRPAVTPVKHRTKADFVAQVEDTFKPTCSTASSGDRGIRIALEENQPWRGRRRASRPSINHDRIMPAGTYGSGHKFLSSSVFRSCFLRPGLQRLIRR
jgi:uncharacterized protein DUF2267